jgi:tripartite-type tricarboxylate transporter receptor subunit TctC
MKFPRRRFLHLAAGAATLPAVSRIARAQTYPVRPVRIIVGFAPGGGVDIVARLIGQWLSERLGQPFVIENRLGAATNIGTEAVVRASPDGYTLLLVSTTGTINATFYDKLNFNLIRDIAPVAGIMRVPNIMEVNPSVPAKTWRERYESTWNPPEQARFIKRTLAVAAAGGNGNPLAFAFRRFTT